MDPQQLRALAAGRISRRTLLTRSAAAGAALAGAGVLAQRAIAQSPAPASPASPAVTSANGLIVRPNAKTLDATQKANLTNAILTLKIKPSPWFTGLSVYDSFVLVHRDALNCAINAAHMGPAFLPWHRQFLQMFEEQLRLVEPSVVLPYWDWTVDQAPDSYLWQDDLMGPNGDKANDEAVMSGPFKKGSWEITVFDPTDRVRIPYITRDFGAASIAQDLPTAADVEDALAISTYDSDPWTSAAVPGSSFRNTLEGWRDCAEQRCSPDDGISSVCAMHSPKLHNRVHLWVSGEFGFRHMQGDGMDMGSDDSGSRIPMQSAEPGTVEVFGTMAANSSPNDPVFWLHHANIDRLWSIWMARHGQVYEPQAGGPVGHNIDDPMWPYMEMGGLTITPRMMLDSRAMGFVYDTDLT